MVDAVPVFRMNHRDAAVSGSQFHSSEHFVIRHHHSASGVGHEHLERYYAHLDEFRNLILHVIVCDQNGVNAKISIGGLVSFVHKAVDCVESRAFDTDGALVLNAE